MVEELYGGKGIDTPYEREKVEYQPHLEYPGNERYYRLDPQIIRKIERSKEFSLAQTLMDYDQLIDEFQALLDELEKRNDKPLFHEMIQALNNKKYQDAMKDEDQLSGPRDTSDAELYVICYRIKASCVRRRNFLDQHYRSQLTNETDMQLVQEAEQQSINDWVEAENEFIRLTDELKAAHQEAYDDEELETSETVAYLEQAVYDQEVTKKNKEVFHTTIADTAYIHRNRTAIFFDLLNRIKMLVYTPQVVMPSDLKTFILKVASLNDTASAKAHLILAFRSFKEKQNAEKGQYMLLDDNKEDYISKLQWFHQQLESKAGTPLKNWLYNQTDDSEAFNVFADFLVGSLQDNNQKYNNSLTDLVKFYQQEGIYYEKQLFYIQKKEQIRRFLRILEDLEGVSVITEDWATEYLTANGYDVL
jgi:hypothetical protein